MVRPLMKKRLEVPIAGGDTATPLNLGKRLDLIARHAGPLDGKQILDCGCGAGEYVRALSQLGADARGIEYSREKVESADLPDALKDRVQVGDIAHIDFEDKRFDVAMLNEVLEHVPDEAGGLREVQRILKPGGILILFSPCRLYPFETHGVFLKGSRRRVPHYTPLIPYIPIPLGRQVFDYWARNYWPWELKQVVEAQGFKVTGRSGIWQTFENISGRQPAVIRALRGPLRWLFSVLEKVPLVRAFGASQLIVAVKQPRQSDVAS